MANKYVYHGGTGVDGNSWASAYTLLANATAAATAGDTIWVAHDHLETGGSSKTINSLGTEGNPCKILSVNRAGSVPPVAADLLAGAQVTTTGASSISLTGSVSECYGVTFAAGSGASTGSINIATTASRSWRCVNCTFYLSNTSTSSVIGPGPAGGHSIYENCVMRFSDVNQRISSAGRLTFRNTVATGFLHASSTIPTNLFNPATAATQVLCEGLDLSLMSAGKNLVANTLAQPAHFIFKDCKLGASNIVSSAPAGSGGTQVTLIRCSSSDVNYNSALYNFMGTLTTDPTTTLRTGGASDGTTPIAWKVVTQSATALTIPFECPPITVWNETVGSLITITVHGQWAASPAVPTNAEAWLEVAALTTSGFPLATMTNSRPASTLTTPTNCAAGSGWSGSGEMWKMEVTITPQEKGPITIYVKLAKPATTFWIDPKPVIT